MSATSGRAHFRAAFTFTDAVFCVLLASLTLAVVVPAVAQVNEQDARKKCSENLRQIGMALLLYSNENRGAYPRTRHDREKTDTVRAYTNAMSAEPFGDDGPGPNDVSSALFLLLRTQDIPPEAFVCPATGAKPWDFKPLDPADPTTRPAATTSPSRRFRGARAPRPELAATVRANFPSGKFLGYSYANPYPSKDAIANGYKLNNAIPRDFAVAADMNPGDPILPKLTAVSPDDQLKQGNSVNHKQDGQNVLFGDGSVQWAQTPFCGVKEDNVFTFGTSGEKAGGQGIAGSPEAAGDSVLLPTALD